MLKRIAKATAICGVFAIVTGCGVSNTIPQYTAGVSAYASEKIVSKLTEIPATDYHVPHSQVFVGGKKGITDYFPGLLTLTIDTQNNSPQFSKGSESLTLSFQDILKQQLVDSRSDATLQSLALAQSEQLADVILLPSVRLHSEDGQSAKIAYRLTARFKDPVSGELSRKDYYYLIERNFSISGVDSLAENGGAKVTELSQTAFRDLVLLVRSDIAGNYKANLENTQRKGEELYQKLGEINGRTVAAYYIGDNLWKNAIYSIGIE